MIVCRYCERRRLDVQSLTFMPDTCCRLIDMGGGEFRRIRQDDLRPSDVRVLLLGLTPAGGP